MGLCRGTRSRRRAHRSAAGSDQPPGAHSFTIAISPTETERLRSRGRVEVSAVLIATARFLCRGYLAERGLSRTSHYRSSALYHARIVCWEALLMGFPFSFLAMSLGSGLEGRFVENLLNVFDY